MKIIKKRIYEYGPSLTDRWKESTFKPLKDVKISIQLDDSNIIEAAVFTLDVNGKKEQHACVSTQVGCKFGCKFCSSGENGFVRNLSDDEINKEINLLIKTERKKLDYIVFMGIGEPLDNFDNVVASIKKLLKQDESYAHKISLATSGLPDQIEKLANENLPLDMVWISLHAADNKKRSSVMPINKKFPIEKVLKSVEKYYQKTKKMVWLNYMLFADFNDTNSDVKNLLAILKGKGKYLGLIITQPNNNLGKYQGANQDELISFEEKMKKAGLKNKVVWFITAGKKVGAGCGEFIFTPSKKTKINS